jgi:CHRD domain
MLARWKTDPKKENNMLRTSLRPTLAAAALAAFLFAGVSAHAATESFTADLKGATEVPPNDSKGTGAVTATYDTATKKFSYTATYTGLTGPATAAHFHGPAAPGANAPPVVPVPPTMLASPIKGDATLTDAQAADLEAGKWYFNVHTAAHGPGEIRGQVMKK